VRMDHSGDTKPELPTSSLRRAGGLRAAASLPPLGLQPVFPELRPDPLAPGEVVPLVLGRDGEGDGRLSGSEISRRHAELRGVGGQLHLRDLGSRNGLFVNGERCPEATLALGDVVRMGEWVAVVVALDDEAALPESTTFAAGLHLGRIARQVAVRAGRVARTRAPVVLEGESGTGKERFARAIHEWSERAGPFIAVDCAALPGPLAEAELFGDREGAFRSAHGGTLFLDEVTELPLPAQAKLLRVLEQGAVLPVDDPRPPPVDVRVMAATQVPLAQAVADERFRADLRALLDGFTVRLLPLRERRVDVPSLFLHLLAGHGLTAPELSPRLVEALCVYDWPVNVRELDHLAQQLTLLHGQEPVFRRAHLPDRIRWYASGGPQEDSDDLDDS
jgi:transcriptional regulator of acetoin/glycerol metabolism